MNATSHTKKIWLMVSRAAATSQERRPISQPASTPLIKNYPERHGDQIISQRAENPRLNGPETRSDLSEEQREESSADEVGRIDDGPELQQVLQRRPTCDDGEDRQSGLFGEKVRAGEDDEDESEGVGVRRE